MARAIGSRTLIVLVTMTILLLIAEAVTRVFSSIQLPLKVRDPEIGRRYIRNFSGKVFVSESNQHVHLTFNRDGFRGSDRAYAKPPNTCRIAIMGDSQIAAIATEQEYTLVCQLEELLNEKHPTIQWEVLNFGVSSGNTAQELVSYRKVATKYDPDMVICAYYIGNDFADNCSWLDTNPRIHMAIDEDGRLYVKPFSPTRKRLSMWLNRHSRFYVWQKQKLRMATWNIAESGRFYRVRGGPLIFMNKDEDRLNSAWILNGRIIQAFHAEVASQGRSFLFVVIPNGEQLYDDNWQDFSVKDREAQEYLDVDHPDRKLTEIVNENGIDHVFVRDGLVKFIDNRNHSDPNAHVIYGGRGHLNAVGNRLSAEIIHAHLQKNGTISQLMDSCSARKAKEDDDQAQAVEIRQLRPAAE